GAPVPAEKHSTLKVYGRRVWKLRAQHVQIGRRTLQISSLNRRLDEHQSRVRVLRLRRERLLRETDGRVCASLRKLESRQRNLRLRPKGIQPDRLLVGGDCGVRLA